MLRCGTEMRKLLFILFLSFFAVVSVAGYGTRETLISATVNDADKNIRIDAKLSSNLEYRETKEEEYKPVFINDVTGPTHEGIGVSVYEGIPFEIGITLVYGAILKPGERVINFDYEQGYTDLELYSPYEQFKLVYDEYTVRDESGTILMTIDTIKPENFEKRQIISYATMTPMNYAWCLVIK